MDELDNAVLVEGVRGNRYPAGMMELLNR